VSGAIRPLHPGFSNTDDFLFETAVRAYLKIPLIGLTARYGLAEYLEGINDTVAKGVSISVIVLSPKKIQYPVEKWWDILGVLTKKEPYRGKYELTCDIGCDLYIGIEPNLP